MPSMPTRDQIEVGTRVLIETKKDQGTGRLTEGMVDEILTSSNFHPYGIKVRLVDGYVGRVKETLLGTGTRSVSPSTHGFTDLVEINIPTTEDMHNEFKEFYQYNKTMDFPDKDVSVKMLKLNGQRIIATAVCAFGNSQDGGFVYIGVNSDGVITGLEKDRELEGFKDYDDLFANHIRDRIGEFIDDKVFMTRKIRIKFRNIEGKTICIIQVLPSYVPLWLHHKNNKVFFVRGAVPRAEKLDPDEQVRYIRDRFPDYR